MCEFSVLNELVAAGLSQRQIAQKLGFVPSKVFRLLKKHNLATSFNQYNRGRSGTVECRLCEKCGETDPYQFYGHMKQTCKKCHVKSQLTRWSKYKQEAVEYKGGKCEVCGYAKCFAALAFHHKDPSSKDPDWRKMKNRAFRNWKHEVDKCLLVCHNCHAEIHHGIK